MFEFIEKYLIDPLAKLSNIRLVRAIQAAGMAAISFLTVGSIFLVIGILPEVIPALSGFYANTFDRITDLYMLAQAASLGVIALYFLLVVGYEYTRFTAEEEGVNLSPITGMLLCLYAFMLLVPQLAFGPDGITRVTDPETNLVAGWKIGAAPARFGATGIFTAIIVSWLAINIYKFFIKRDIRIKMPDSVPDGVSNSFSALIPVVVVSLVIMLINGLLVRMGTDVFGLIAIPFGFVSKLTNSWIGFVIIILLQSALWIVGIHGAAIIGAVISPVYLYNLDMNASAGTKLPLAGEFMSCYTFPGGAGATLGLMVLMVFAAKSEHYKMLGKASIVPGLFQINEPVIFGLPLVYNPAYAVPFMLAPIVTGSISYFAITTGIVRPIVAATAWPTPPGINAFIATAGDWKAAVLSILCVIVSALIYYPFFRKVDSELYKEQLAAENAIITEEVK